MRYWSKNYFFIHPTFDAIVRASPSEYCHNVWCENIRMVWLPEDEKSLTIDLYLAVWTLSRLWWLRLASAKTQSLHQAQNIHLSCAVGTVFKLFDVE